MPSKFFQRRRLRRGGESEGGGGQQQQQQTLLKTQRRTRQKRAAKGRRDNDNFEEEEDAEKEETTSMLFARVDEEELLEESDSEVSEMDHGRGGRVKRRRRRRRSEYWKRSSSSSLENVLPTEEEEGGSAGGGFVVVAERSEQTTSGFVANEEKAEVTSAKKKKSDEVSDPVYRLLRYAQREDDEQMERFATVPEGFDIALVNEREVSADARLKQLNKLFQREDERIGDISKDVKECFGLVLEDARTREAVGYALFHDRKVHEWEATKKLTVSPPRLSHVFVKQEYRRRGFGTALVCRWIKEFAIDAKAFAVDMPNGKMLKLLKHARCEVAVEKSGFEAGTIHFLNLPI
jgi:GNAT superfamily N-acetyltransferase